MNELVDKLVSAIADEVRKKMPVVQGTVIAPSLLLEAPLRAGLATP